MALRLGVDVELLAVNYLRNRSEITTLVTARMLSVSLDKQPAWPALVVFRLGGIADHPGWLDGARLQVDAWGATKASANLVARTALAALLEMPDAAHTLGVVTGVDQTLGLTWAPDETTDQPRYLFGVTVSVHPPFQ